MTDYGWILEDIRWLRAKKWKTKDDEACLKELCELRSQLVKDAFIPIEEARQKRNYDKFNK